MSKIYFILLALACVLIAVFYNQFLKLTPEEEEILKKQQQRKQSISQTKPVSQIAQTPQTYPQVGQQHVIKGQPKEKEDSQCDDGKTDIIRAAGKGQIAVVKCLIKKGANVNAKDNEGWTALKIASQDGHVGVVQILL